MLPTFTLQPHSAKPTCGMQAFSDIVDE
jgi:hypothetical protein